MYYDHIMVLVKYEYIYMCMITIIDITKYYNAFGILWYFTSMYAANMVTFH